MTGTDSASPHVSWFRPRPGWEYIVLVSLFLPGVEHLVRTHGNRRTYFRCCRTVDERQSSPGTSHYHPAPGRCPLCQGASRSSRDVLGVKVYYFVLAGVLAEREDPEEEW